MKTTYKAALQEGILLNSNEADNSVAAKYMEDLLESVGKLCLNRYPNQCSSDLRKAYAKWLGLDEHWVLAGNGSDQILSMLITALAGPNGKILTLDPDFGMYDFYAGGLRAEVFKLEMPDDAWDVETMIDQAHRIRPDMILFSNPNNPTGFFMPMHEIAHLARHVWPTPVVVDEAYVEFAPHSSVELLKDYDNLYITRTLSKAWGLAGARVGFVISQPENIEALEPYRVVYSVSALDETAALCALRHPEVMEQNVALVKEERNRLESLLDSLPLMWTDSQSNFVSIFPTADDFHPLGKKMEQENIRLRFFDDGRIRITLAGEKDNARVREILEAYYREK